MKNTTIIKQSSIFCGDPDAVFLYFSMLLESIIVSYVSLVMRVYHVEVVVLVRVVDANRCLTSLIYLSYHVFSSHEVDVAATLGQVFFWSSDIRFMRKLACDLSCVPTNLSRHVQYIWSAFFSDQ